MKKMALVAVAAAMVMVGCASMAGPTPEDRQRVYAASTEDVVEAIRSYMFDTGIMITGEGDGWIAGELSNTSVATGMMTGGSATHLYQFQYRQNGEMVQLNASVMTEVQARKVEPTAEAYHNLFASIAGYLD